MSTRLHSCSEIVVLSLVMVCQAHLLAQQRQEPSAQYPIPSIKSEVNEVLVPVVVTDAQGYCVGGLKKENFQIVDQGKPQIITGFNVIERTTGGTPAGTSAQPSNPSVASQPASATLRFILLVFDNVNMTSTEMMQSQKAAVRLLSTPLPTWDNVAVLSTSGFNSGLTRDNTALQKAILGLKVSNRYRQDEANCPNLDYYQADLIENKNDPFALQAAIDEVMACSPVKQPDLAEQIARQAAQRAIALGDQDFRADLNFLRSIVKNMATLPGQRVLIWVSKGFLTPTEEATRLISEVLDMADRAGVTISTIDARGLYTADRDISERRSSSMIQDREQEQNRASSMASSADVMAVLAEGSGGTYFHNSNDLTAGMDTLFAGPRFLYMLAFSPSGRLNGRYHALKVKVGQKGLRLRSRHGYFAPKRQQTNQNKPKAVPTHEE